MTNKKVKNTKLKLHPRSKHRGLYNFKELIKSHSKLAEFVKLNDYNNESIDFFNPNAVKSLNTALLKHFYGIKSWDIPPNYLIPPIPGRADYIHYIADLLSNFDNKKIPKGNKIRCLDIGTGASCIYPIIGTWEYKWSFVASDIDPISINSAKKIISENSNLKENIEIRLQNNSDNIFNGIIKEGEFFDVTMCNPPFHSSQKEARAGTIRKLRNLKNKKHNKVSLNFGGQSNELWCNGGEEQFVENMIRESQQFAKSCLWFTCLISKESKLNSVYSALKKAKVSKIKTIEMGQGNKKSRIVAWSFF